MIQATFDPILILGQHEETALVRMSVNCGFPAMLSF